MSKLSPKEIERTKRSVWHRCDYATIEEYAGALIQLIDHYDVDGRPIGFDYAFIRGCILRKFPVVRFGGPHTGKPTKMSFKELQEIACELNRRGIRLPFRPRRKLRR